MLALLNASFPDLSRLDPLEARAMVDARVRPQANQHEADVSDSVIDTPDGKLKVRHYTPAGGATRGLSLPLTLYAHGGGFLHGSIASHDGFCRRWAHRTGADVLSVEYRLAPEHGAPSASRDLASAAEWAVESGIASRVVLAGDSAGAGAAAVAALLLAGHSTVRVAGQVLIYPFLDPTTSSQSYAQLGDSNFVTATALRTYWRHYLAAPGSAAAPGWHINPLLAPTLAGLPPAVVVTAGLDPLRDEGREYARALGAAGVPTLHRFYPGQFHGFLTLAEFGPAAAAAELLWADIAEHILSPEGETHASGSEL